MYGEQQRISALNEGINLAKLNPSARGTAMIYGGAKGLGNAIGSLMGVEDPQMKIISARQQIIGQLDQTNPQSYVNAANQLNQIGDAQGAIALMDYARKAESDLALVGQRRAAEQASLAQASKTQLSIRQEEQLRDELSKLGPDATQDQVLAIVTKYGSPDKVLAALQASADKAAANVARNETAQLANQARIDAAKVAAILTETRRSRASWQRGQASCR
jgi:hypothetical protein